MWDLSLDVAMIWLGPLWYHFSVLDMSGIEPSVGNRHSCELIDKKLEWVHPIWICTTLIIIAKLQSIKIMLWSGNNSRYIYNFIM